MNRLFWTAIVSCHCWAQADLMPNSLGRTCTAGNGQTQVVCISDLGSNASPELPPKQPAGETISISQLQHKIPKKAAKAFQRARKLSGAGEHEQAAAELEAALRRDPKFASAENQLGVEYSYLERWDEAEVAFRRVISIEPDSSIGHYNLALTLYSGGDFRGAEQSARRALALSSANPRIHLLLGELLVLRDQTRAEGLTELRFAARTLSDARWALRVLGTR